MKIIDYKLVGSTIHLDDFVKESIALGWQPIGGVAVGNHGTLYQAMVKYEEMAGCEVSSDIDDNWQEELNR